jgi:hypothetical protein
MDDEEIFRENINEDELNAPVNYEKTPSSFSLKNLPLKYILIGAAAILLLIILIVIIIIVIPSSKSKTKLLEVNCDFEIANTGDNTQLVGKNFAFDSKDVEMYINNVKTEFKKEYKFDEFDIYRVDFHLYSNEKTINLNEMFKDVSSLRSVGMYSKNNAKIVSMQSTFENCEKLEAFQIIGVDTSELKSISKIFAKTKLRDLDFEQLKTTNIEDMSYMFADSELEHIDLSNLDTSNAKNLS